MRRKVMGNEVIRQQHRTSSEPRLSSVGAALRLVSVAGVYKDSWRGSRKHKQRFIELFLNARNCSLFEALYRH